MKKALGIAVNGQNIKIAELIKTKDNLFISILDDGLLVNELENPSPEQSKEDVDTLLNESSEEPTFGGFDSDAFAEIGSDDGSENFEILHSLFQKFAAKKIQTAFNAPADKVIYKEIDPKAQPAVTEKKSLLSNFSLLQHKSTDKQVYNILAQDDGPAYNVYLDGEEVPVIQSSLEQLNSLFRGNLLLTAMLPNEVALVNLVNRNYNFDEPNDVSAIIYIEGSVSRIIFLKGSFFWFVSPLYVEGDDENINALIYSKILFELDNHNIENLSNIFLACGAVNDASYIYFMENFPDANIDLIISHLFAEKYSLEYERPRLAEYAIPIALAFETINARDSFGIKGNLLPAEVINQHKILKLSKLGYGLLGLLAAATLTFTYITVDNSKTVRHLIAQNQMLQEQIIYNQDLVEQVDKLSADIANLEKSLTLSDSLGLGYDNLNMFLDVINQSVKENKSLWITHLENNNLGFNISGASLKRDNIPMLSKKVGYNLLKKVYREQVNNKKIYNFEMDVKWPNEVTAQLRQQQKQQETELKTKLASVTAAGSDEPMPEPKNNSNNQPTTETTSRPYPGASAPSREVTKPPLRLATAPRQQQSYAIFVKAFFSSVGAENLVNKLASIGIESKIYQANQNNYNYCVSIGRFGSEAEARQRLSKIAPMIGLPLRVIPSISDSKRIYSRFLTDRAAPQATLPLDLRGQADEKAPNAPEEILAPIKIPRPENQTTQIKGEQKKQNNWTGEQMSPKITQKALPADTAEARWAILSKHVVTD